MHKIFPLFLCMALLMISGCRAKMTGEAAANSKHQSCLRVSAPIAGLQDEVTEKIDIEIRALQQKIQTSGESRVLVEQLGWKLVEKAQRSYDQGFFRLAGQCADCLAALYPRSPESLLLRSHVLHNLHQFREAEKAARELVSLRGLAFDYGVLGDALMEQGQLDQAVSAYQRMIDLKPNLQSYGRAAHMRWLKGDLEGAVELMRMATGSASPNDPVSAAWAYTRLAFYEFQSGQLKRASSACDAALALHRNNAAGMLVCGRLMWAEGRKSAAIDLIRQAVGINPLPETRWALADMLRASEKNAEAEAVEAQLIEEGEIEDPRTLSLFLATRGEQVDKALALARKELEVRQDVFTLDAMAWALAAAGKFDEAREMIRRALAEGTQDARFYLHAAVINAKSGNQSTARKYLMPARKMQNTLLPGEIELLTQLRL